MGRMILVGVLTSCLCVVAPRAAASQTMEPEFRKDIEQLLEVTGAAALGRQMAEAVSNQFIAGIQQSNPDVPKRVFDVVRQVIEEEFTSMYAMDGELMQEMVRLYARYFTHDEIRTLLAFQTTPVGRKAIAVMPKLTAEGMAIGQKWGEARTPGMLEKLQQRLRAEGLLPSTAAGLR